MSQKYNRIMLKLSGEVLQNKETGHSLDVQKIESISRQIKAAQELDTQITLVVGGGNIFRGLAGENFGIKRSQGDHMGMMATVINSLAIQAGLESLGVDTRVMSAINIPRVCEPFILRKATRHLEKGRVVIFAAGTGNPYFTTDSAAALRASEIDADILLKATKVDGVYDKDPMKFDDAVRYDKLGFSEAIAKRLGIMDTAAFSLCQDNEIPIIVFDFFNEDSILKAIKGEQVGTLITDKT